MKFLRPIGALFRREKNADPPAGPTSVARRFGWLEDALRDLSFAWRVIAKAPVISTVIVLSLALGLGANTAVFSWIHTVALEPLPGVREGRSLMVIEQKNQGGLIHFASPIEWRDLREQTRSFTDIAAHSIQTLNLDLNSEVVHLWGEYVTANFFDLLGVQPALGRWPSRHDDLPGSAPVAVISHRLWRSQFNSDSAIIGRVVRLKATNITIVGVAPPEFQGAVTALALDVWLPQGPWCSQEDRKLRRFQLLARLRPGVSADQADADVALVLQRLAEKFPESNRGHGADVIPCWRSRVGAQSLIVPMLATMQAVMLLLLLVVCTNTANLLLAQASTRSKEIAIRLSLGAGRARLVRQLLTEGLVLGLLGALVGTLLAIVGLDQINRMPKPSGMPIAIFARFEVAELFFSIALGVVCAVGFALAPAWQTTRGNVGESLKIGGRTSGAGGRRKLQEALVATEIALTLVIVITAGLFVKSFNHARTANPGFAPRQVALGVLDLAAHGYDPPRARAFAEPLLARVRETPGVQAAAVSTWVPLDLRPMYPTEFELEGRPRVANQSDQTLWQEVSRGYFETLQIEIVEGRDFTHVAENPAAPEAVINEEFRRRYLPDGQPAIGRQISFDGRSHRIVGVVRTGKYSTLSEAPQPFVYRSLAGRWSYWTLFARTSGDPVAVFPPLQQVVRGLDGGLALFEQRTFEQHLQHAMILRVIPARILAVLGPLALFLAVTGLYSVLAYAVAQRTHEIGVRMTLGATTRAVVLLIVRQGFVAVGGGLVLGWIGAYAVSVRLSRELVEVPAGDPLLFIGLPLLLAAVALLACWLPARRAAKVDPMQALRAE